MSEHRHDLELVRRLRAGDEREFSRFFAEYYPRIYRFALVRLGDEDAADDVAQGTLCRAVRKLGLYRGEASLFTWLCQICRHEIHDFAESRGRHERLMISVDDEPGVRAALESLAADVQSEPASSAHRVSVLQLVQVVLDYLPPSYGNALEWKYIEDVGVAEIANRLGITELAAESLLARARRAFKDAWMSVTGQSLPGMIAGELNT
jgi:RNA polymerase sigma-70 factor (ECF subfamily)